MSCSDKTEPETSEYYIKVSCWTTTKRSEVKKRCCGWLRSTYLPSEQAWARWCEGFSTFQAQRWLWRKRLPQVSTYRKPRSPCSKLAHVTSSCCQELMFHLNEMEAKF